MSIPYAFFTSAYPAGTWSLGVEDLTGGGGTVACPVVITADAVFFELPDSTSGGAAAAWPDGSLVKRVLASLQTNAAFGGTWSASWEFAAAIGVAVYFAHTVVDAQFLVTPPSGTPMPLTWFGYADQDGDVRGPATRVPFGCWYPRTVLQDFGDVATPAQVFSSGPTADGSFHTVQHDDGSRPRWYRYTLDGSMDGGVDGGRMMTSRLTDTWRTDWASTTGLSDKDAYAAFDAVDGWWYRTLDGTPFKIIRSVYEPESSIIGPKCFVFPDPRGPGMPVDMSGWLSRGEPNVITSRAGRRLLDFCCTDFVAS